MRQTLEKMIELCEMKTSFEFSKFDLLLSPINSKDFPKAAKRIKRLVNFYTWRIEFIEKKLQTLKQKL